MKKFRLKGQALALVLIIVVVSIIIAFAITGRILQDIKQQTQERASTRAETLAETTVEYLTQQLQSGTLVPQPATNALRFGISNQAPPSGTALDICRPDAQSLSQQCDTNSIAQISFFKMVVQFKMFSNESIETHLVQAGSPTAVSGANAQIIVHLDATDNATYNPAASSFLVKAFVRTPELKLVSECLVNINSLDNAAYSAPCQPNTNLRITPITCPDVTITLSDPNDPNTSSRTSTKSLGQKCAKVEPLGATAVSFYRIMPLLSAASASTAAYTTVSTTGVNPTAYELPVAQMAMINAGVYTGGGTPGQQVFQQTTRLILLNKSVPEVADYVLYNGSALPVSK